MTGKSSRTDRIALGIAFISAGALTFEVGLTRLFAIQQFHHFAFVVVSLAVMGFAASGLALSLRRRDSPLTLLAGAFTLTIALSYLTSISCLLTHTASPGILDKYGSCCCTSRSLEPRSSSRAGL